MKSEEKFRGKGIWSRGPTLAVGVSLCLIAALGLWLLRQQVARVDASETREAGRVSPDNESRRTRVTSVDGSSDRSDAGQTASPASTTNPLHRSGSSSKPEYGPTNQINPSGQSWTYRHDFQGSFVSEQNFVRFERVEQAAGGVRLKMKPDGKYETVGVVQSPAIPTQIPINAVGAHWAQELADGTRITMEVATSSDGVNWTDWQGVPIDSDSEVKPFYPDGRPNPNYGDTIGALVSRDDNRGQYVRYRATLATDSPDRTPILHRVGLTYLDSSDPHTNPQTQQEPVRD